MKQIRHLAQVRVGLIVACAVSTVGVISGPVAMAQTAGQPAPEIASPANLDVGATSNSALLAPASSHAAEEFRPSRPPSGDRGDSGNKSFLTFSITDVLLAVFTFCLVVVGAFQWRAMIRQVQRLDETIRNSNNDSERRAAEMAASIGEAKRAASAMEDVAKAMELNVKTSAEIAERQRDFGHIQLRAYVRALAGSGTEQNRDANFRFEGEVIIDNRGATSAKNVYWGFMGGFLPNPMPPGLVLEEPPMSGPMNIPSGHPLSLKGIAAVLLADEEVPDIKLCKKRAFYVWGKLTYDDIFDQTHTVTGCYRYFFLPDGKVKSYYVEGRNTAD